MTKEKEVEQQEEIQEETSQGGEQQERNVRVVVTHMPTKVVYELPIMGERSGSGVVNQFMSSDKMNDPLQMETKRGELVTLGSSVLRECTITMELVQ